MSLGLAQFQASFAQALFAPADIDSPVAALSAQPAFAVYRNTVMKACIDALEANYPAVARLVGSEWFRAAAALYVAARPPNDARMLRYGDGFPDFLRVSAGLCRQGSPDDFSVFDEKRLALRDSEHDGRHAECLDHFSIVVGDEGEGEAMLRFEFLLILRGVVADSQDCNSEAIEIGDAIAQ